ncbi:ComEC family competence protein [Limihaloglobus sulfuriphilus]|uniref:ComEC family competence protein n=1 Tax=Limihaloglobus sulfuriphilus TaxID=1851148 RepID=A0A1Q2MDU8_9BACT|nr:ComEC/Rec2 family competence protein [Limihaloglobus sulfuriphilus]AQQ70876.1 ComEC family competence protein [Limihaloglobus sulfuriphilus]
MDRIEYNIELLRRRISPEHNILTHTVNRSPLLLPAAGITGGILLHEFFSTYLLAAVAAFITGLFALAVNKFGTRGIIALLAVSAGILLGYARIDFFSRYDSADINSCNFNEKVPQVISATVLTHPLKKPPRNWSFSFADFQDERTSIYARVNSVFNGTDHQPADGKIFVTLPAAKGDPVFDALAPGTHIKMNCIMRKPRKQSNPGQFDFAGYLAAQKIKYTAFTNDIKAIEITGRDKYSLTSLSGVFRTKALELLAKGFDRSEPALNMAAAVTLGERSTLPPAMYESLRKSGLMHLLSLSGLHIGMITAMIWWLGKLFALTRKQRGALCLLLLMLFILAVPSRSPVIRAAVVCSVFCLSAILGKRAVSFNTLSLAAIILLLVNPRNLFNTGFVLSFLAVAGILIFYKPIQNRLVSVLKIDRINSRITRWLCYYILSILTMGTCAMIFGAGACLYYFYGTNILSPVWTILSMPVFSILLSAGLLKIAAVSVIPGIEYIFNPVLEWCALIFSKQLELTAAIPAGFIQTGSISAALIAAFYLCLLIFAYSSHYQKRLPKRISAGAALAVILMILAAKWTNSHPNGLRLTVFSVGHGACSMITLPDASCYIMDCGSKNIDDLGRSVIINYAAYRDIKTADAAILSHNHLDHVNGIDGIVNGLRPEKIIVNRYFCDESRSVARTVMEIGKGIINSRPDDFSDCDAVFSFYSPQKIPANDINAQSMAAVIEYAGRKIIFPGDMPPQQQRQMLEQIPDIRADILILPHHGFSKWAQPSFIEQASPSIAIGSCREYDYLKRGFKSDGITTFYTPVNGCIEILIKPDGEIIAETMH